MSLALQQLIDAITLRAESWEAIGDSCSFGRFARGWRRRRVASTGLLQVIMQRE